MEQLQISRKIKNQMCLFILSDEELEMAYRIKQKQYLEEDFAEALADKSQDPECRFDISHLKEFPELAIWLCRYYDHFFDANIAHNDLITLTLNHLRHASMTPEFFTELARLTPAICESNLKNPEQCENHCCRYYSCSNIAEADDRSKKWELLSSLLSMHKLRNCICNADKGIICPAAKYLSGDLDIRDFYYSLNE